MNNWKMKFIKLLGLGNDFFDSTAQHSDKRKI